MSNKYVFPFKHRLVFALVLQDKKRCANLVETILGRKVRSINIVNKHKGVRPPQCGTACSISWLRK